MESLCIDVFYVIVEYIPLGSYKNFIYSCKEFYNLRTQDHIDIRKWTWIKVARKYPDKSLDWYSISKRSNITMEIVEANPNLPWDWDGLAQNPNITIETIRKYPNKFKWNMFSTNPNITPEIITQYINNLNSSELSFNPNIPLSTEHYE